MLRKINKVLAGKPTIEGAGVHLKRAFGFYEVPLLDPFLLLDDFHSSDPDDYIAGFPWHPHRGIETVTYVLKGEVEHGDGMGNKGVIGAGDVQWMTAGSGIIHQEMPRGHEGELWGFQLWVNLPSSYKMMDPRYREVRGMQIPEVPQGEGVSVRIISGEVDGVRGPVQDIVVDPEYLDVAMAPESVFEHGTRKGYKVLAYVVDGSGHFEEGRGPVRGERLVVYGDGTKIKVLTGDEGLRFLLFSGRPLNEPVAWMGPIVMNTQSELNLAFEEYRNGTFIKRR